MDPVLIVEIKRLTDVILETSSEDQTSSMKAINFAAGHIKRLLEDTKEIDPASSVVDTGPQASAEDEIQEKRRKRNEQDLAQKPGDLEQRAKAGEYVLTFGAHKNKPLKQVPMDYMRWMLGTKQQGREFTPLPADKTSWIRSTQMEAIMNAQMFMRWRCWACGEGDTRFKNAKLCASCWHSQA